MAMFLAGDIGSMEDLITDPAIPDPPCNSGANGCFAQVRADRRHDRRRRRRRARRRASPSRSGPVDGRAHGVLRAAREQPLQGRLRGGPLRRAPGLHELPADRAGSATRCTPRSRCSTSAPDLQFLVNPGEAFPGPDAGQPLGHRGRELPDPRQPAGADLAREREVPLPGRPRRRPDRLREAGLVVRVRPADLHVAGLHHRSARPQPQPRGRGGRARGLEHGRRSSSPRCSTRSPTRPPRSAWAATSRRTGR